MPNFTPMTILESIEKQVSHHIKGAQVFHKEDIIKVIKEHNLIFTNDIKLDEDEQGEHLILTYDEAIVCLELTWRQEGPRFTLIEIRLA